MLAACCLVIVRGRWPAGRAQWSRAKESSDGIAAIVDSSPRCRRCVPSGGSTVPKAPPRRGCGAAPPAPPTIATTAPAPHPPSFLNRSSGGAAPGGGRDLQVHALHRPGRPAPRAPLPRPPADAARRRGAGRREDLGARPRVPAGARGGRGRRAAPAGGAAAGDVDGDGGGDRQGAADRAGAFAPNHGRGGRGRWCTIERGVLPAPVQTAWQSRSSGDRMQTHLHAAPTPCVHANQQSNHPTASLPRSTALPSTGRPAGSPPRPTAPAASASRLRTRR